MLLARGCSAYGTEECRANCGRCEICYAFSRVAEGGMQEEPSNTNRDCAATDETLDDGLVLAMELLELRSELAHDEEF